ncbi:hypothetical protein [Sellimonas caecigallum]|uniref:hypothetical protein n=1 Tax=Sellimonas caecigallum TaxID=2592333 RepID=UPI000B388BBE|nr:hypothetical protein B5F37_12860 [Drancourtella sp. An210]
MLRKKKFKILSAFLIMALYGTCFSGYTIVNAAQTSDVLNETVEEKEISLSEYKDILIQDEKFTPEEADKKIENLIQRRGPVVRLYRVVKTKTETIKNNFKLECRVTVYVYRDQMYGNVEIDHATAPTIGLIGPVINSSYSGNQEATNTPTKLTVDYNGHLYFTVTVGVSVGFGTVSASTSTTESYSYGVSGQFIWNLSEI